ncbi:MAG TPA: hypothetical protein VMU20_03375 [Candidatus Dormibacteraeota bacterium]|nr:hypothetical protein [Candidatus Dormibacteraeota bacterium]
MSTCSGSRGRTEEDVGRLADSATSVLGPRIVADTGEWGTDSWTSVLLGARGYRLGGGGGAGPWLS